MWIGYRCKHFCSMEMKMMEMLMKPSFSELTNRSLIAITGPDTRKFLQNLTTNNIDALFMQKAKKESNNQPKRIALYTIFLNPKGKIITDAFIIRPRIFQNQIPQPAEEQLWIDVPSQNNTHLQEHLKRYTWKKKVAIFNMIHEEDKPSIYAGFSVGVSQDSNEKANKIRAMAGHEIKEKTITGTGPSEDDSYANLIYLDPRNSFLGVRIICGQDSFFLKEKDDGDIVDLQDYEQFMKGRGICGPAKMRNKLPFMFNSDLMNGFSFNKGCYLGQQIISRSYFTGIVRRRTFPFYTPHGSETIPEGTVLKTDKNEQLGKVIQSYEEGGIALCNYLPLMDRKWPIDMAEPHRGIISIPFEKQLRDYLSEMKKKQETLSEIDL